nr:hypothetical protein [Pyrococcus abyssi]
MLEFVEGDIRPIYGVRVVHVDNREAFLKLAKRYAKENGGIIFRISTNTADVFKFFAKGTIFVYIKKKRGVRNE